MVDFDVWDLIYAKDLRDQTLIIEARVLNPKACGVQGRSLGGCVEISFRQMDKFMDNIFSKFQKCSY